MSCVGGTLDVDSPSTRELPSSGGPHRISVQVVYRFFFPDFMTRRGAH